MRNSGGREAPGHRTWPDDLEWVEQLYRSMRRRLQDGHCPQNLVAADLSMDRTTLYRNVRRLFGLTWRQLERLVFRE